MIFNNTQVLNTAIVVNAIAYLTIYAISCVLRIVFILYFIKKMTKYHYEFKLINDIIALLEELFMRIAYLVHTDRNYEEIIEFLLIS